MLGSLWSVLTARRRGQSVVDYGMIVAAGALVSIVGLNAMSRAQEEYWKGTTQTFASPTPGTGTFTHATKVKFIGPSCDPTLTYVAGSSSSATPDLSQVKCTVTVQDQSPDIAERTPPQGQLQLQLDSGLPVTCSTAAGTLTPTAFDTASCPVWVHPWTRPEANQTAENPPHVLQGSYTAISNHQPDPVPPSPPVSLSFWVVPQLGLKVTCNNPIYTAAAWNNSAEVGHPLICSPTLLDPMNGVNTPYNSAVPTSVTIASKASPPGVPLFNCYTNNNYGAFGGCSPPAPTLSCTVPANTNGIPSIGANCPNPAFIYRRGYDDSLGVLGGPPNPALPPCQPGASAPDGCWAESFTLTVLSQTLSSPITITAPAQSIGPTNGHPSGTFVQCTPQAGVDFGDDPSTAVAVTNLVMRGNTVPLPRAGQTWVTAKFQTAHRIKDPGVKPPITCTAIVFDGDPSAMFDSTGCTAGAPWFWSCNPDASDAHAPLGMVIFQDTTAPYKQYAQCALGHTGRPTFLGGRPTGQPEYASWCQVPFNTLTANTLPTSTTIRAQYQQETSVLPLGYAPAHAASWSPDIVVDFT